MERNDYYDPLPGVSPDSDLRSIYDELKAGKVLTSLDAVRSCRTVNLPTYISTLRKKYGIAISDRWVQVSKRKKVKEYYMEFKG